VVGDIVSFGIFVVRILVVGAIVIVVTVFEIAGVIIGGDFVSRNNGVDDIVLGDGVIVFGNILVDAIFICS